MKVFRIAGVMLALLSGEALAKSEPNAQSDTVASVRHGIMFTYGLGFHRSSASSYSQGGNVVQIMTGYYITTSWYVNVGVLTGSNHVDCRGFPGTLRRLSVGGARFQTQLFLGSGADFRPFVAASWDMMTLLTHEPGQATSGFNGGGPRIAAGVSWEFSSNFATALHARTVCRDSGTPCARVPPTTCCLLIG